MAKDKFNFISKLHLAASDDDMRPVMNCIHFIDGYAYVSNSYIVVKQNLEYSGVLDHDFLNGKSIHKDSFKEILGYQTATATEDGIECVDKEGRKAFFDYQDHGDKVPDFENIFQQHSIKSTEVIGFHPDYLKTICDAMYGAKDFGVKVLFNGVSKGMLVQVQEYEDQVAILMPMAISESLF
ncbi:hypothetical protein SAMN06296241_1382 [Salinimicrobium sediminis]|uniref:Uncharacterized protein n=1 Tax=Salinimicrobium sediminis TaxID=1343891 RepID=A0A285X4Z7_9FLAO|nr:hypothetical protein [Salinimicrobium sediminis]SOC79844.1 hypothetical protein SAMN06296241_1382 [Salinimicrobium sediminis]